MEETNDFFIVFSFFVTLVTWIFPNLNFFPRFVTKSRFEFVAE